MKGEKVVQGSQIGMETGTTQLMRNGRACAASLAGAGVACMMLAIPTPVLAQAAPQRVTVQAPSPGTRFEPPPGAVFDDPNRVFGDEAPVFAPFAIVGALGLRPYASLQTTFDNNLARQPDGAPLSPRFNSKSDWVFRPAAGIRAEQLVGRQRLFANASIGRSINARNSQLNNNRINVGGGAGLVLGRWCGGQIFAGYSRRDALLGSFEEAAAAIAESTTFSASANCATATGITASVGYNRGWNNNRTSDPTVDRSFADAESQSVNGSLGYRVGVRGQVGVSASWGENVFPNQLILGEENANTVTSYSLFGSYRIGSALRANASIGRSRVSSSIPGSQEFSGGTWNLGVGYSGPRLGANITFAQGVNGGGNQAANFAISRSFIASSTYRLNDAIRLSAGIARVRQDFRGNVFLPDTTQLREVTDDRVFLGANYRLNRILSFSLDLNHQRRSTSPDNFSFRSSQATLGIAASF
jgi:hypothetical protein